MSRLIASSAWLAASICKTAELFTALAGEFVVVQWRLGTGSGLAGTFLNGRWQSAGFLLLAIGDNRSGIPLQAIVIQYIVVCR